jgi:putative nucleotidyltransferase with HDIG domain
MGCVDDTQSQLVSEKRDTAKAKVLFLDDEQAVLNSLRRVFRNEQDIDCYFAESPQAAVEIVAKTDIAVLVTDHRMPTMTGADLLRLLRQKRPGIVAIMLTGQADNDAIMKAVNEGEVYRYFTKPWQDEKLVAAVREAIAHKRKIDLDRQERQTLEITLDRLQHEKTKLASEVKGQKIELESALYTARDAVVKLDQTYISLAEAMVSLIELARPEIGNHSREVARHALEIGQRLGLKRNRLESLYAASLLHDIGKLGLPVFIMEKNATDMSEKERKIYESHPSAGAEILKGLSGFNLIREIIQDHHEHYNGTGFPRKLRNEKICSEAYIVGITDMYDRLINRPHQNAEFVFNHAYETIRDSANKNYPERLVHVFLDYLDETQARLVSRDETRIRIVDLFPNIVLSRNVYTMSGTLLAAKGTKLTNRIISRIRRIADADPIAGDMFAYSKLQE